MGIGIGRHVVGVLCIGEPEAAIEGLAGLRYFALLHQKFEVLNPNAGHLVQEDQSTLKRVVDSFVDLVRDATLLHLCDTLVYNHKRWALATGGRNKGV